MNAWLMLFIAGLLEAGWAIALKAADGFSRPVPAIIAVVLMVFSMGLLGLAQRSLPISTAYAVWVGIGVVGAFLAGVTVFGEALTPARLGFAGLLVVALIGLKLTTPAPTEPPSGAIDPPAPGASP